MYAPFMVAATLRDDPPDDTLALDVELALRKLPTQEQAILRLYAQGYSPYEAGLSLGIKFNQQRAFNLALRRLTDLINGGGL